MTGAATSRAGAPSLTRAGPAAEEGPTARRQADSPDADTPAAYLNPYVAGVGLGLVLLAAFVVMGRGLGASGAFTSMVAAGVEVLAPEHARANGMFGHYLAAGPPWTDWLVWEILGVAGGGLLSALLAGRFRSDVERGPRVTDRVRLLYAFGGGAVMGVGAKLARGCTSGQALTGGALLSAGSWLFIAGAFAAGYTAAPLFRRQWL